jgi:sigma-B regulation protein RsbU (phosphoserine phosphatase)
VASALVANRVHSAVHAIMSQGSPPPEMIGRLNHFIYDSFADLGIFVTLLAMQFDLANGQACYCGAGHPPALLHRRNGDDMVALESAHLPIGVADNIFIGEPMRTVPLGPGDAVWLYTDGLMELRDARGEILGVHGLSQRLKSLDTSVPHPGLAERALAALLADFESPDDDITLVAAIVK